MTDFAKLVMSVDATGMLPGDQALDRIAQKGAQADAQVTKATTSMSKGMSKVGAAAGVQANGLRTLVMQIGQITQQTAAGANAINAIGMQLGDILPMLGIGGLAGVAATAAGIMAPLAVTLFTAGDSAKDTAEKIEDLSDAVRDYVTAVEAAGLPTEKLIEKYGRFAEAARETLRSIVQREQFEALQKLNVALSDYTEGLNGRSARGQNPALRYGLGDDDVVAFRRLKSELDLSDEAAAKLTNTLNGLASARSFDDKVVAVEAFKSALLESLPPYDQMTDAQRQLVNDVDDASMAMFSFGAATDDAANATLEWASAMGDVRAEMELITSLLGSIGGTMITNAKISAAKAVRDAGGSAAEAKRAGELAGKRQEIINGQSTVGSEYYGMSDAMIQTALGQADQESAQAAEWSRLTTADPKAKKTAGAKKNSYEKDVFTIQKETESMLAQADAIAKVVSAGGDWERALRVIETEQELLTEAQRAGLKVTPELKDKIHEMAEANVDAKEKLADLREATENGQDAFRDLFGSIIDGSGSAKDAIADLLAEIAKVQFTKGMMGLLNQTSWGGGLISAIGGLLSYDGGGYTGDGARVGGIDGKGGSLAVVHPQESIIDHTKGQSTAGYGIEMSSSQLTLTDDGKIMAQVNARVTQMGQAVSASIPGRIQQFQNNPRRR